MEELLKAIVARLGADRSFRAREDLYFCCLECQKTDRAMALAYLKVLQDDLQGEVPKVAMRDIGEARQWMDLHKRSLLAAARDDFDSFIQYMEWNRAPAKKFYMPRRAVLKQVVDALQELSEQKLKLLCISLPPGTGKTTLAIFYLVWMAGKFPNEPSLTGSHSNSFVRGVYDECLRMVDGRGEYLWHDVFPEVRIANTNAKDCRIDFGTRKRFETLEFTSIGTGNAGLYRATRLLYCDDLVSGIEVALSKDRLDKLWGTYTTDLLQRRQGDHCVELHIATRWSVHDVIGRLEEQYAGKPEAKFIVIPAMDENDESNFDYDYGVGYTTEAFRKQREIMDEVSWKALFMNYPIEREGLLYSEGELKRYFTLPDREPDAIIGVCDTKTSGTDYCVLPVGYKYGQDYYIEEFIFDNGLPEVVDIRLADILLRHKVQACRFESNAAGGKIAEKVEKEVKAHGGRTSITTQYTTQNKETKILINSSYVKEHCYFKDASLYKPNSEYGRAINALCSYTLSGKNKHDDVPDAMAMFALFAQSLESNVVTVVSRPW